MKRGSSTVRSGQRFGRLVTEDSLYIFKGKRDAFCFRCKCDCGNQVIVPSCALGSGNTRSCGCLHKEQLRNRVKKHGESRGIGLSSEYRSWCSMIGRCCNETNDDFAHYGGRGIMICSRWRNSFELFLKDMGRKPTSKHSLERKDVNGDYMPSNCRWATQKEQTRNKRNNRRVTIDGVTKSLVEWVEQTGIKYSAAMYRLSAGWDAKKALFTPSSKDRSKQK